MSALGDSLKLVESWLTVKMKDFDCPSESTIVIVVLPALSKVTEKLPPLVATDAGDTVAILVLLTVMVYAGDAPLTKNCKTSPTLPVAPFGCTSMTWLAVAETVTSIETDAPTVSVTRTCAAPAAIPLISSDVPETLAVAIDLLLLLTVYGAVPPPIV